MELERRSHAYDASRGTPEAFSTTVVDRCSQNYVRDLYCGKRHSPNCTSTERSCVVGAKRSVHARCGMRRLSDEERGDLTLDLEQAIKSLPPELRRVAELLKLHNKSEAARRLGLPRLTFLARVAALKRRFESAGLRRYV